MMTDDKNGAAATTPNDETLPAKATTTAALTVQGMIEKLKPQLERALPKHVTADRIIRIALTALRSNPRLQQCDPMSLMGALMTAAQLGLEPNTPLGQCYLIPYRDGKSGKYQAQYQIGYKGIVELALRTGMYKRIAAHAVDEADTFHYTLGLNPDLQHIPADKPAGKSVYFYAVYELQNGGQDFRVWSREKVEQHARRYSKAFGSGPWQENFDAMACKTVVIDLLRLAPKSVELADAIGRDNRTIRANLTDPDLSLSLSDDDFALDAEVG